MANELKLAPLAESDQRSTEHLVVMRDGVRLATDVYLPDRALWPVPAVLVRLPYDKSGRYTFLPSIGEYFAAKGFACVVQDVRGKYRSEGERVPFFNEANDGWDTAEWIVLQDWSDGAIGTWGDSYYGFTQWALASLHHPAHRAMVPRVTGHHFGDMRPGGGMPTRTLLDWVVDAWALNELVIENGADHEVRPALESTHPELSAGQELLREYIAVAEHPAEFTARLFPQGDPAANLRIPALHTGGWLDNLQYWQLDDWYASLASPAGEHQFLRMWSNDHEDYLWREPGTELGQDFGESEDALRRHIPSLLAEVMSFFDHYLRGETGRWSAPVVSYEHIRIGRRIAAEWPPKRVRARSLALDGDQLTDPRSLRETHSVSWVHDPSNPVPYLIESEWDQNRPGLPDEQHVHLRDDVVTFTGEPLVDPLDIVGRVEFTARVSAETECTHVMVRLCDVASDGSARLVLANAVEVLADGETPFAVRLGDTAYRFPKGHRMRLAISTSLHGQYVVHPGTDEDAWLATETKAARQELHLAGAELRFTQDCG